MKKYASVTKLWLEQLRHAVMLIARYYSGSKCEDVKLI